jgi:prepilin-type processing-associated H-X9-DG protein
LRVSVVAQATSDGAAEDLKDLWLKLSKALARQPGVQKVVPAIDEVLVNLTPQRENNRLLIRPPAKTTSLLLGVAVPAILAAHAAIDRTATVNRLKQLVLALHNYHDKHKRFPASANYDSKGRPLLSWRVHLLPFLDQQKLYEQFRLDEPWDSEHNSKLIEHMPDVYARPGAPRLQSRETTFLAPLGAETAFSGKQGIALRDITDGTSHTILLVAAHPESAVPWTQPSDLVVTPQQPVAGLAGQSSGGFCAAFADGHVETIADEIDPKSVWEMFTRAGGERR